MVLPRNGDFLINFPGLNTRFYTKLYYVILYIVTYKLYYVILDVILRLPGVSLLVVLTKLYW